MRNCKRCEGTGKYDFFGTIEACVACNSTGVFAQVDDNELLQLIVATKGKNKGKLRASMSSPVRSDGVAKNRAYYVWRMARFHGGVDTTMPITAGMCVRNDPYQPELDELADKVAVNTFGSNMAAAYRWGRALGMLG